MGEQRAVLTGTLMPALAKLRSFLAEEYLEQARPSIAATDNPGGEAYYAYRIEENTTLPLTAQQVHETGLAEVARINAAIDAAEAEAGGRTGATYTLSPIHIRRCRRSPPRRARWHPHSSTQYHRPPNCPLSARPNPQ